MGSCPYTRSLCSLFVYQSQEKSPFVVWEKTLFTTRLCQRYPQISPPPSPQLLLNVRWENHLRKKLHFFRIKIIFFNYFLRHHHYNCPLRQSLRIFCYTLRSEMKFNNKEKWWKKLIFPLIYPTNNWHYPKTSEAVILFLFLSFWPDNWLAPKKTCFDTIVNAERSHSCFDMELKQI